MVVVLSVLVGVVGVVVGWFAGRTKQLWGGVVTLVGFVVLIWWTITAKGDTQRILTWALVGFSVANFAGWFPDLKRLTAWRRTAK